VTYNIFAVRAPEDEDGRLYPVIGGESSWVDLESTDGATQALEVRAVVVQEWMRGAPTTKPVVRLMDGISDVLITDARLVVNCRVWNKGGRAWGIGLGATAALIENRVHKISEARKRRGKMCLGHVRYEWIQNVGYKPRGGFGSVPQLRLVLRDGTAGGAPRSLYLDVGFSKSVDTPALGRAIMQRAARYWLAQGESRLTTKAGVDEATIDQLKTLAAGGTQKPPEKHSGFLIEWFPVSFAASQTNTFVEKLADTDAQQNL